MTETVEATFRTDQFIVYPAHGVGKIVEIKTESIGDIDLELFIIDFPKDKMTLRVPTNKVVSTGMRPLSAPAAITKAMQILVGRPRNKKAMWSRRAQEYEQKINSGDLTAICEVVRDLHRNDEQREQSYSERQLYESALDRLTREVAAVEEIGESQAMDNVIGILQSRSS